MNLCESCNSEVCVECFDSSVQIDKCDNYISKYKETIIKEIDEDKVNHPKHYTNGKYETIDIIEDMLSPEEFIGFCIGNSIKYLSRYKYKNGLEDIKKAQWYIKRAEEKICTK